MVNKKTGCSEEKAVKGFVIFILLGFSAFILRYIYLIFSSDSIASDVLVQEILSCKSISKSIQDYVAQQTFFQFNFLFYVPKLFLQIFLRDMILTDKLNVLLSYLLFLLLAYLVSRSFVSDQSGWIVISLLGCGLSFSWTNIVVVEQSYTIHMIYMLLFLLIINAACKEFDRRYSRKQYCRMAVLSLYVIYILSFDQRYAAIFIVPYCIAVYIVNYIDKYKVESFRKLDKTFIINLSIFSAVMGASIFTGLLINWHLKNVLHFSSRMTDLSAYKFADFKEFFQALAIHFSGILQLWGCDLDVSISVFSIESAVYLIKGVACIGCMVVIPVICFVRYQKLLEGIKKLLWFYVVMSAVLFYIYVLSSFSGYVIARYFVYEVVISIIISAWYLYEHMIKTHNLNRFLIYAFLFIFMLSSLGYIKKKICEYEGPYAARETLIQSLHENGFSYGYATYWNAQILTSMSNAKLKVLPVLLQETTISPFYDLNYIHQFSSESHAGNAFLLFTSEEYTQMSETMAALEEQIGEPAEILTIGNYVVLTYNYNIADRLHSFPYNDAYALS